MKLPPIGIYAKAKLVRVIDGDTIVVEWLCFRSHVRLLDCYAPESHEIGGKAATDAVREVLNTTPQLHIFVPDPGWKPGDPMEVLKHLSTMGRVLGHVFLNADTTLSDFLVRRGLATRIKGAPPPKKVQITVSNKG